MDLFTYLMAKNDHNTSVKKDLFSYLLGKNQSGTYTDYSGTSLSINNTKKGKMKIDLKGNTSQEDGASPDSPQPIHSVTGDNTIEVESKQLVNFQDTTKYLNQSGANLSSLETGIRATATASGTYRTGYYIVDDLTNFLGKSFKIVATITPSASNTGSIRMFWFTGTSLNGEITPTDNVYNIPSTPVNNKIAILFYANSGGTGNIGDYVDYTNLMFISSASSNDYVPYQSQTLPINLGTIKLNKIGTYQDYFYKDSGKWYLHKEIGKVVLDGSEEWNSSGTSVSGSYSKVYTGIKNEVVKASSGSTLVPLFCNYYISKTANQTYTNNVGIAIEVSGNLTIFNADYTEISTTNFTNWLSTHNTIVYYPLATPYLSLIEDNNLIEQLNEIEKAKSYKDQTNINQVNDDLPFELDVSVKIKV